MLGPLVHTMALTALHSLFCKGSSVFYEASEIWTLNLAMLQQLCRENYLCPLVLLIYSVEVLTT